MAQLLDISTDLGPGATPAELEGVLRGIRVATDVARDAEIRRLRRTVTERMRYPTDNELRAAVETLPEGGETSPRYRAERQLAARQFAWREGRFPPDLWIDYLYRFRERKDTKEFRALSDAGYDRLLGTPFPLAPSAGLEVLDSDLYDALVADQLARSLPGPVVITTLSYRNPFLARLLGRGNADKTISTTVQVVEVARDFGAKRDIGKADAAVATGTVADRIAESQLDVELKREALRKERLLNDRQEIENAHLLASLSAEQLRRQVIEQAMRRGELDIADAVRALDPGEVQAIAQLSRRPLELREHSEPDDPDDQ